MFLACADVPVLVSGKHCLHVNIKTKFHVTLQCFKNLVWSGRVTFDDSFLLFVILSLTNKCFMKDKVSKNNLSETFFSYVFESPFIDLEVIVFVFQKTFDFE